ncbi:MAG: TolC family protein, partial [Bacteroidaceae bacterium]|nr:TolC family protein [Bacteroidaceae bacterium]
MKKALFLLTLIFSAIQITAQEISYSRYMERVLNNNIALTAKRMDIDISDAAVENSRVYNDPSVALTYTNNEDWSKGLGQGIELELSRTFTFGVRRSRIDLAESERR